MSEISQEQVDSAFEQAKKRWDKKVAESGKTESMFIALDRSGFAMRFLANYQFIKQEVEELGLIMPELIKGIKISFRDLSEN